MKDIPPRLDGLLFPPDLANLTLPGGAALYTQLVEGEWAKLRLPLAAIPPTPPSPTVHWRRARDVYV